MADSTLSLLVTKLHLPSRRATTIPRPDLFAILERGWSHKLILIAAAAGSGKTTLMAEWACQHPERVCWLALDEGDHDPARFVAYLIAAIQTCAARVGQELLPRLLTPRPPALKHILPNLINQLAAHPEPLLLVLDDYHAIANQEIHDVVQTLLAHLPAQVTVALLSRADPPLPLARMRSNGELLELRAHNLLFSEGEAGQFLNDVMALELTETHICALTARTEGWAAGLQLAALAMQSETTQQPTAAREAFIAEFTGSHRHVLDYLMEEVLERQPDHVRDFMMHTSVLHRFNTALCEFILPACDSPALLDYLDRNNLFLIPLDATRQWYRYHHLFADLLYAKLLDSAPDAPTMIRRQAATWHAQNGDVEQAIDYAFAANAFGYAVELIQTQIAPTAWQVGVQTWLRWYRLFPLDFLADYPELFVVFGQAFATNGRWAEALPLLQQVDPTRLSIRDALVWAFLNMQDDHDITQLAGAAERAQSQQITPIEETMLALVLGAMGDYRAAWQTADRARKASDRVSTDQLTWIALTHQCRLMVLAGELQQGQAMCQQVLAQAPHIRDVGQEQLGVALVSLGRIHLEWNELDQAAAYLKQALEAAERTGFLLGMLSSITMLLAEVHQAQGDEAGARDLATDALHHAAQHDSPHEVQWLQSYQMHILLQQGDLASVGNWLKAQCALPPSRFYPHHILPLLRARVWLAQRNFAKAITLLTELTAKPTDLLAVEAWILLALARQGQGDGQNAQLALTRALSLAAPENRIRVFLNHAIQVRKPLQRFCAEHPANTFAHQLLSAFPTATQQSTKQGTLLDPLSDRELEILRLIVAGQSNKEIAETLILALGTVKWYINSIYGKLHVKSRSQAIARTHERNLLS